MAEAPTAEDELVELLAAHTGRTPEEIKNAADEMEIRSLEDADWERLNEDWTESPAHQQY